MALVLDLIARGTRVTENGDGPSVDVRPSQTRTFLCKLDILDQIEQESLDVSIWGSTDGQDFGAKPILKIPQRFYRGDTKQVLDLTLRPEIHFIRAHWDLFRWGRVAPHPMFIIGFRLEEVPVFAHSVVAVKI
jgi:hypothetical protein